MNKFLKIFFLLVLINISGCSKDESSTPTPVVFTDFDTQYNADNKLILEYLKTHAITFDADMNPTYALVPSLDPTSIWGADDANHKPNLLERKVYVKEKDKDYIIYFLQPRKGSGQQPCNVDRVYCSYEGKLMSTDVVFDYNNNPQTPFNLTNVITAWNQIFPQFQTAGSATTATDGSLVYSDFGAGVMFVPSVFGYYGNSVNTIPSYSNLIFSFKLFNLTRLDQDFDGVLSNDEDLNHDHYFTTSRTSSGIVLDSGDDTDGDGKLDFVDIDDDNDNVLTNYEIRRPVPSETGGYTLYPFNGALVDDPTTANINETQGIPSYVSAGVYDYTTTNRLRLHVDKSH